MNDEEKIGKMTVEDTDIEDFRQDVKESPKKEVEETAKTATKMTTQAKMVTVKKSKNINSKRYSKKTISNKSESIKDDLYEPASVISSSAEPVTSTNEAERNLHHKQTAKKRIENRIKKLNKAINIKKKSVKDTAIKSNKRATTGADRVPIGTVAGESVGRKMDKQDRKKSARNRMIQLFAAKLRQEDNQDSIGKALKDVVMMRFTIVIKKAVAYAALFLFGLFALAALAALPIIAVIAVIYNSPLAIFFPSISSGETTQQVLSAYISEFNQEISTELIQHSGYDWSEKVYVNYEGSGTPDNYYDILSVYMVKYGNGDTATDMKNKAKENLKKVFEDMCSYSISSGTNTEINEEGNEIIYSVKYVKVTLKTYHDMISEYGFNSEEIDMLLELMKPEYLAMLGYTGGGGDPGQTAIRPEQYQAIIDAVSDANGKKVLEFALSKAGYPYSQAFRDSGNYYDCSSLAYYAWRNAGIDMMYEGANTAASEGKYCYDNNYLVAYDEMQPGDLIFYSYANNGRFMNISHVAVYVGDGRVVEAVNEQLGIVYRPIQSGSSIVFIGRPR